MFYIDKRNKLTFINLKYTLINYCVIGIIHVLIMFIYTESAVPVVTLMYIIGLNTIFKKKYVLAY